MNKLKFGIMAILITVTGAGLLFWANNQANSGSTGTSSLTTINSNDSLSESLVTDDPTNDNNAQVSKNEDSLPAEPIVKEKMTNDTELIDDQGTVYPIHDYKPLAIPNDPSADQWWVSNTNASAMWDVGVGGNQTILAIIDTGIALTHEEFSGRWHENTGEAGTVASESASKLNCTDQSIALDKACNLIDDDFDGVVDNESGTTTQENISQLNCTDQSLALDKNCNLIDDDGNGLVDDWRGWDFYSYDRSVQPGETDPGGSSTTHGTIVAGVAAATGNNNLGIAGVDWFTKILPIQAMNDNSSGNTITVSRAIRYAADQGADVISLSLATGSADSYLRQSVAYATARGSIVVAAAGNDGCDCILYPAGFEEVIAVGASDSNNLPTSFSSYGSSLDILAPGITMSSPTWASGNQISAYTSSAAGTSFAAPFVAGMMSLARSHQPDATALQLIGVLTENTSRLTLASTTARSNTLGFGLADGQALLTRVTTPASPAQQYVFAPVSGGKKLAAYELNDGFLSYQCGSTWGGSTNLYRLAKSGLIFYTISPTERYQAQAAGYTSSTLAGVCMDLPTDTPQSLRNIVIPREFENNLNDKLLL